MLTLTVRCHGGLGVSGSENGVVKMSEGSTLLDLQDRLGIARGEVGLFLVDGELRNEDEVLHADALVDLLPLFGGG